MWVAAATILSALACANAFIIPEELPTILSVVYSNIPPIKLGFDTRFGFGFRIGPHLDFQTLIEIGPQINTNPIGLRNETVAKRQSQPQKQFKPFRVEKKLANQDKKKAINQPTFMDILMGRKTKKQVKPFFDEKGSETDSAKKGNAEKNSKQEKDPRLPTKFVIF